MSDIKYYRLVAVEKPLNVLKGAGQLSLSCTYCGKVIDAMGGGCLAVCLKCAHSNRLINDVLKLEARNKDLESRCLQLEINARDAIEAIHEENYISHECSWRLIDILNREGNKQ